MEAHRDLFKVNTMCKVFGVSRSGFYDWVKRDKSSHKQEDEILEKEIKTIFDDNRQTYGTRRIKGGLAENGKQVSRTRIGRLMKKQKLEVKTKKKFKFTTNSDHDLPVANNLLNRGFEVAEPDCTYVGDITYIWTDEGWLYLAVFLDLFSRQVVGWSMSSRMKAQLVINALEMACERRSLEPGLIVHSDRGSQYASKKYQKLLEAMGFHCSMSRKGNCWERQRAGRKLFPHIENGVDTPFQFQNASRGNRCYLRIYRGVL